MLQTIEHALTQAQVDFAPPLTAIEEARSIKIFLWLFDRQRKTPFALAKIARGPLAENLMRRAYNALHELKPILPRDVAETLPAPLTACRLNGRWVVIEQFLPGTSMTQRLWTASFALPIVHDFRLARAWLCRFQRETASQKQLDAHAHVHEHLANFLRYYPDAAAIVERLRPRFEKWRGVAPLVRRQGDFWAGNLLVTRERSLRVLDWEFTQAHDCPFFDPLMFVCAYAVIVPARGGMSDAERFKRAFLGDGIVSRAIREFLSEWRVSLGVRADELRAYMPLFLMQMATREQQTYGRALGQDQRWHEIFLHYAERADEFDAVLS
jgi:hypothetical protein